MIVRRAQPWLGTLVEVVAEGDDAAQLHAVCARAFARIAEVHVAMSFQDAGSELTHINRAAQNDWVALSPDIAEVLAAALDFAQRSSGLFDPCVGGRLVAAGRLPRHAGFPAEPTGDWRAVEFDGDRVRYAQPLLLDFSGIAKGYAVDRALAELAADGVVAATVNAGGDLARYGDSAITVHLRDPLDSTHILPVAELTQGAAATSADYFQPGHLVHPESGAPLCGNASVTVFAASCLVADALTKIVAADLVGAPIQLAAHDAQAIMLDVEGLHICDTDGWRSLPNVSSSFFSSASHGYCPKPAFFANRPRSAS
jgi:thiamine biosynthesis lipoprotein